jgi:excisionase family DNA binding protein
LRRQGEFSGIQADHHGNSVEASMTEQNEQDQKMQYPGAAEVTGLKIPTLQSMVCRKQIPHYRLGKRLVIFSRRELVQWMADRSVAATK